MVCSFASMGAETELTTVTLQLKWKHQFQFAGYYAAIKEGYYKDQGIDVKLVEADFENNPIKALSEEFAEFTIVTSDVALLRSKGYDVVVLASIFQHSALILLAPEWSGISHVHNLVGKRIMMEDHAADLIAYLNDEGISLDMLNLMSHDFNVDELISKEIDIMSAYSTTEPYMLKQNSIKYTTITPRSGGIDFYGDVLVCSGKYLVENTELTLAFREASLLGWNYAMNHKEEIIDYIFDHYSQRLSKDHLRFEAEKMQDLISPELVEIGYSNPGRW